MVLRVKSVPFSGLVTVVLMVIEIVISNSLLIYDQTS